MRRTSSPELLFRLLPVTAALLLLNQVLAFSNWWPTPAIVPDHRLAPEFIWLWVVLLGIGRWRGALPARVLAVLTSGYLLLVLGRYVDVTAPALFGRAINLYWDVPQIPRFLWVAAQDLPLWISVTLVSVTGLLFWGLYRVLRWAIALTALGAVPYALQTRWVWGVTAAAVVLVTLNHAGVKATWPLVSKPVIPTYVRQANILLTTLSAARMAQVLPPSTVLEAALSAPQQALAGLQGRDVYLMPLESYGAVTYDHVQAAAFRAMRARFAGEIGAAGLHVVSAFLKAPTFGGASDLSHLSLLSGIDLTDPLRHDLLLTTRRPTLISLFQAAGYEAFGVYSSLSWEWPERAYFGFDTFVDGPILDYPGPSIGPWFIPDQYAVARFEQRFPRSAATPPRFVFMSTITSHFPFHPIPPFQPDRERLLRDQPFDAHEVAAALAEKIDWLNMFPGYQRMIDYQWRWLGDWLHRPLPRDTLFILVGDHQPTANISGEGASWDVPIHIVSRDANLLAGFVRQGFTRGMEPPRQPIGGLGGLHDLPALLLGALDTAAR
jgi:hypothetical protein